ncbi:hypothetical protein ACIQVT_09835 [Streptomyces sp. NPDC100445]|uniref:hypothetical protein n=1 Tax=Streptomyces sp. NPDC100445 TaxID=3366102 RepID=UPI003805212A
MTVWTVAVAVGGGLTLVLQDEARPGGPYVWENGDDSSHPPDPDEDPSACRTTGAAPESGRGPLACARATALP